jgi:hypothetical protein
VVPSITSLILDTLSRPPVHEPVVVEHDIDEEDHGGHGGLLGMGVIQQWFMKPASSFLSIND